MPHHPDFDALFYEDGEAVVNFSHDSTDDPQTTRRELDRALVHYQDDEIMQVGLVDKTNTPSCWHFLRKNVQPAEFLIILNLASRHSLAWTEDFIESLVYFDDVTQTFTINAQQLKTLIFLQKHCGLQSRDFSYAGSSYTILDNDVRLLERAIEGDNFNQPLLDEVSDFLTTLKDSVAMNWTMFLVKQGFLNFAILYKKCFFKEQGQRKAINEDELLQWLTQWAHQCGMTENMMADGAFEAEFIADSALSANQRTLRNMVRYGLSPHWLRTVSSPVSSHSVPEDAVQQEIIPVNATFQSALEHHQGQDVIFADRCERGEFVQAITTEKTVIEDSAESHVDEHDNHSWIQTYTNPEEQYILRQLSEVLSLERLKFYHDYHRLSILIKQVQEGKLSLAEVEEYDKPPVYSTREDKHEYPDEDRNYLKQDYNYISRLMVIKPRKLPRLLAKFTDEDIVSFSQSDMAQYDMFDYDPKNNPTRNITMPKRPHLQAMFKAHEEYLDNLFNQLIIPIAEERSRLYREWHRLNKKVIENPETEHSAGFFGCFYKTPRQEMTLIEEKIELLSGFLREQCVNLKALELKVAEHKQEGKLPPDKCISLERIEHYRTQLSIKRRHETGRAGALQLDPFYHQELRGMISASDLNINHTKNCNLTCFRIVTDEARDSVASFLKATIGAFLAIPAILAATVTAFQVRAFSLKTFYGHFFRTQSHQAICKAEETAAELLQKRTVSENSVRTAAEQEVSDPSSAPLVTC